MRFPLRVCILAFPLFFFLPLLLRAQDAAQPANTPESSRASSLLDLYLQVQLAGRLKLSALHPGEVLEGALSRSVYSRDQQVFPAGSRVRLTVEKLERRRKAPNDHWPWLVQAFAPRHEKYPVFQSAEVMLPSGKAVPLQVSLVSLGVEVEVHARLKMQGAQPPHGPDVAHRSPRAPAKLTANFEASLLKASLSQNVPFSSAPSLPQATAIPPGTQARVVLLETIRASKSHNGDSFRARLVEPVYSGSSLVLPEGAIFEGKIAKRTPPRMLSRPASLLLSFTSVIPPGGAPTPVVASVAGVELDRRSHTKVDAEGKLSGDRPGKAWMAMNLGVTGGLAKVSDDGTQLLIEALVSSATDASTAGTARIAGLCVSGLFLVTRHGRDIILPKFTELEIVFDRPVNLSPAPLALAEKSRAR